MSGVQKYPLLGTRAQTTYTSGQDQVRAGKADAASLGKKAVLEARSTEASATEAIGELQRSITQLRIQVDELSRRIANSFEGQRSP